MIASLYPWSEFVQLLLLTCQHCGTTTVPLCLVGGKQQCRAMNPDNSVTDFFISPSINIQYPRHVVDIPVFKFQYWVISDVYIYHQFPD